MRIGQKYLDYDAQLASIVTYGAANMARLEISADQITAITAAKGSWDTALAAYTNSSTHTPQAVQEMQVLYQSTNALT